MATFHCHSHMLNVCHIFPTFGVQFMVDLGNIPNMKRLGFRQKEFSKFKTFGEPLRIAFGLHLQCLDILYRKR